MKTLTLLRHGRTSANAAGLLQGRIDNPLDDVGVRQAAAARSAIGPVDAVVSSPLLRALQTAAPFGEPVIDDGFIELDYGDWDGQPISSLGGDVWQRWRGDLDLRPPGGETLSELGARVRNALEALVDHPADHVLVTTHVSPIKAAVAWALDVGDEVGWRTHLTTGSYTQIRIQGGRPVLTSFNTVPQVGLKA